MQRVAAVVPAVVPALVAARLRTAGLLVALTIAGGCVRSTASGPYGDGVYGLPLKAGEADPAGSPQVIVRDYPRSPSATVLGWMPEEAWQGLRAEVRRDGALIRDHQLFLSSVSVPDPGALAGAAWHAYSRSMKVGGTLQFLGTRHDRRACEGTLGCTPFASLQARIPDEFLRRSRDSVVVRIAGRDGDETVLTIPPQLIASYLATVDSVSGARRFFRGRR